MVISCEAWEQGLSCIQSVVLACVNLLVEEKKMEINPGLVCVYTTPSSQGIRYIVAHKRCFSLKT